MKLYYAPGACSMAPHIALCEAGLSYDLEKVDLAAKTTEGGADYTGINPKGYVPALALDDGQVLTEVSAVVQYIADRAPGSGLAPQPGTTERYKLLEWLGFIATEVHKGFGPLWKPDTPEAYKAIVRDNLAKRFGYLDSQLVDRDHLMGSGFTVADAYCFTILNWTNFHSIDLTALPNVSAYVSRVAARPKVQQAMREEGLIQ
jgi:glutathione S-transferase